MQKRKTNVRDYGVLGVPLRTHRRSTLRKPKKKERRGPPIIPALDITHTLDQYQTGIRTV